MTLEKCKKCGGNLIKKNIINSGNTKFQLWRCKNCSFENAEVIQEQRSSRF